MSSVDAAAATLPARKCEFSFVDLEGGDEVWRDCPEPATVYGGFVGANDWAGRACDIHAHSVQGFHVWDRLDGKE